MLENLALPKAIVLMIAGVSLEHRVQLLHVISVTEIQALYISYEVIN